MRYEFKRAPSMMDALGINQRFDTRLAVTGHSCDLHVWMLERYCRLTRDLAYRYMPGTEKWDWLHKTCRGYLMCDPVTGEVFDFPDVTNEPTRRYLRTFRKNVPHSCLLPILSDMNLPPPIMPEVARFHAQPQFVSPKLNPYPGRKPKRRLRRAPVHSTIRNNVRTTLLSYF